MIRTAAADRWTVLPHPRPHAELRLFCFPYAGGGASIYVPWPRGLPLAVEVRAVQPPGREARLAEVPFGGMSALVEAMHAALRPQLDRPFAFFGHSNGALMAFELTRALRRAGDPLPVRLIASGRPAPQVSVAEPPVHELPHDAFVAELRRLGGTSEAVLENPELLELLLPLLRADFALSETYRYVAEERLPVPISAFGGVQDAHVTRAHVQAWAEQTSAEFACEMLPGDHFFLNTHREPLLAAVGRTLAADLIRLRHG